MKMTDGSDRLPDGTYVRVDERLPEGAHREERHFVGVIVGTDLFASKYQVGERYGGWGGWRFAEGGSWVFPREVTVISAEQALEISEEPVDA